MFHIAILGELPADPRLYKRIDEQFGQIKALLPQTQSLRLLVSPLYTGEGWAERLRVGDIPVCTIMGRGENPFADICTSTVQFDTPLSGIVADALCDRADLLLAVWNGDVTERGGATWELLQIAHRKRIPCIRISSQDENVYWSEDAYYERYSPERLRALCTRAGEEPLTPSAAEDKRVPLLRLGAWLYMRYQKKHAKKETEAYVVCDRMLSEEALPLAAEGEITRRRLLTIFRAFDASAVDKHKKYQAVLYWRSILPLIATLFIAVGFYADTVLSAVFVPSALWSFLAGIGFFLHALLNLYVYYLSKEKTIRGWHHAAANDRYIAEILRVLLHFAPFGIRPNLRRLCGENNRIYQTIRKATADDASYTVNKQTVDAVLSHVEEMLIDQIAYHRASAKKYERIVQSLTRLSRIFFTVGFIIVLLRSVIRCLASLHTVFPSIATVFPLVESGLSREIANMLALLLPAIASYYAAKLSGCNFGYNYENHTAMATTLCTLRDRIREQRAAEGGVPMEVLNTLGEDVAETLLLGDTAAWHRRYMETTVKRM